MTNKSELRAVFSSNNWEHKQLPDASKLDGLYESQLVIVGVVLCRDVNQVVELWAAGQGDLAALPLGEAPKDLYLVFVVDRIDDDELSTVQAVIDDTQVCRKICIELVGRELDEALLELSLFQRPEQVEKEKIAEFGDSDGKALLTEAILEDLASRSAGKILDKLVGGDYEEV